MMFIFPLSCCQAPTDSAVNSSSAREKKTEGKRLHVAWYVQVTPVTQKSKEAEGKIFTKQKHFHNMAHLFFLELEGHLIILLFKVFKFCFTNAALKNEFSLLLEETFGFSHLFISNFFSTFSQITFQMSYTCLPNLQKQRGRKET